MEEINLLGIKFGSTFRRFREKRSMTIQQISKLTGFNKDEIQRIEEDKILLKENQVKKLSEAIEIPLYVFIWESKLDTRAKSSDYVAHSLQPIFVFMTNRLYFNDLESITDCLHNN